MHQFKKVHILHSNLKQDGNEFAFLFPLHYHRRRLFNHHSLRLAFFSDVQHPDLFNADYLMVSSWIFGRELKWWQGQSAKIFAFLQQARTVNPELKIIWCDISDSSGTTQFEVLPYIDTYAKGQLLRDRDSYLQKFYGSRPHTDYYHKLYKVEDCIPDEPHLNFIPKKRELTKLRLLWNTGLANYSGKGTYLNVLNYTKFKLKLPLFYPVLWPSAKKERPLLFSCRIGKGYPRATVAYQRQKTIELLKGICPTHKISRLQYFREMKKALVSISPFGLGEISLRDFEIFYSGGLNMKPSCEHMETWPNLFVKNETYIDFDWDFSDFHAKLDWVRDHKKEAREMAIRGQDQYRHYCKTEEGHEEFCAHFKNMLRGN